MLLSLEDLEKQSGISRHTWRSWIRQRRLAHVRLGRRVLVPEETYRLFVESNRVEARESLAR
jgi:excisionase family DNA binding protein